ncbi:MAG: hypothetical protein IPH62_00705 [Ignavibacteriae bacterium]|nr:hypothetical protein [Ignavibacteriota bacterium]
MKKLIILFIIISFPNIYGGQFPKHLNIISPGIKLGYAFGENGGFVYGFEVSYISVDQDRIWNYGSVLSYDIGRNYQKLHIGIEGFLYFGGVDFGPTLLLERENIYYGYSITPFLGLLIYPYFTYSKIWNLDENTIYELGGYGKIPLPLNRYDETEYIIHPINNEN